MKNFRRLILVLVTASLTLLSCEDYLEKTQKANISNEDIFRNFVGFQGYVETMYEDIIEPVHLWWCYGEFNFGDDVLPSRFRGFIEGDYWYLMQDGRSYFYHTRTSGNPGTWRTAPETQYTGMWQASWFGIRAANISLSHLNDLIDATTEQKQFIEGQAYFFRGYFHYEMMRAWGNVPFIDTVFSAADDLKVPQIGITALGARIVSDLEKAAELLPVDWDDTETGLRTLNANAERINKGIALTILADCYLYLGSPLFNGVETGSYTYHPEYCRKAAEAAWKVIEIADNGRYALLPWADYKKLFVRFNNLYPLTNETIFTPPYRGDGKWFASNFTFGHIGVDKWYTGITQNYAELFESINGYPIDDDSAIYDNMDQWNNRDPRFRYNVLVDRDRQITSRNDALAFVEMYVEPTLGRERTSICSATGLGQKKFWDETMNNYDNGWAQLTFILPKFRLAEIYLIYAEAANEGYDGPNGKDPNANLTAIDAINKVRSRPGLNMPNVKAKFLVSKEAFRERIWNERAVELALEGKRWYDLRRWHVAHLPKYKELYELRYDKDHTYFNRALVRTIQFGEPHYWLPFPINQITLYPEWKQNPGW